MSDVLIRRLKDANVAVVFDDVENSRWWMLRSVPLLHYLVANDFTYPTSWRQLDGGPQYEYLDYEYHVLGGIEFDDPPPLVIVTNRYYERETQYSIQPLIDRYTKLSVPLVVVTDGTDFTPEGGPRPLAQEPFTQRIGQYRELFETMKQRYERAGFSFPLRDTRNVFLQDNAILYGLVEGKTLNRTSEVIDVLPESPYLPLYDAFADIFSRREELGAVPLRSDDEVQGLGRWLRRRIEFERGEGNGTARLLNRAVADDSSTFDLSYARRNIAVAEAWKVADDLEADDSPIHSRYVDWLTRFR